MAYVVFVLRCACPFLCVFEMEVTAGGMSQLYASQPSNADVSMDDYDEEEEDDDDMRRLWSRNWCVSSHSSGLFTPILLLHNIVLYILVPTCLRDLFATIRLFRDHKCNSSSH